MTRLHKIKIIHHQELLDSFRSIGWCIVLFAVSRHQWYSQKFYVLLSDVGLEPYINKVR